MSKQHGQRQSNHKVQRSFRRYIKTVRTCTPHKSSLRSVKRKTRRHKKRVRFSKATK